MLIVSDVDNTLYDWVSLWAGAFSAMVRTLGEKTGHSDDAWLACAHQVHVRRSATECPSLLCEMAACPLWPAHVDPATTLPSAAAAYRQYWDHHLAAYPGVREAITALAEQGHEVVAYTEGDATIAASRLARLGLAGAVRRVFGRPPLPAASTASWSTVDVMRRGPIAVDFIPREDTKPNPAGLRTIVAMSNASPAQTVYVGDNLYKDVVMAQALGAAGVWARYGTARDPGHVALLERVAHWNSAAVAVERRTSLETVTPDAIVDTPRELPEVIARRAIALS